jgi:hypothetical protein
MNSEEEDQLEVGGGMKAIPFSLRIVQMYRHLRQVYFVVQSMERASTVLQLAHSYL